MFAKSQLYEENYRELPLLEKTRGRSKDIVYHNSKITSNPRSGVCLPSINVDESNRKGRANPSPSSARSSLPSINTRGFRTQKRNSDPQPIEWLSTDIARSGWKDRSPLATSRIPRKKKGRKAGKASPDHMFSKENIPEPPKHETSASKHLSGALDGGIRFSTHEGFDLPKTPPYYNGSHVSKNIREPPTEISEPPVMSNRMLDNRERTSFSTHETELNRDYDDSYVSNESYCYDGSNVSKKILEPTRERVISEPPAHRAKVRCSTHGNVDLNACYDGSHASNLLSWIRGTYVAIANARSQVLEMEDPQEAMNIYCNITLQWVRILNMWATGQIGAENFDKVLNIERPCIQMPTNIYELYRAIVDAAQCEDEIGDAELTLASSGSTIIGKWVMQCIRYTGVSCMA